MRIVRQGRGPKRGDVKSGSFFSLTSPIWTLFSRLLPPLSAEFEPKHCRHRHPGCIRAWSPAGPRECLHVNAHCCCSVGHTVPALFCTVGLPWEVARKGGSPKSKSATVSARCKAPHQSTSDCQQNFWTFFNSFSTLIFPHPYPEDDSKDSSPRRVVSTAVCFQNRIFSNLLKMEQNSISSISTYTQSI